MILSDKGIKKAIARGDIIIEPTPKEEHFQTSSVDILLGESFKVWDRKVLKETPGFTGVLDLSEQKFLITAQRFAKNAELERDGSFILKPYEDVHQVVLCQTEGRIALAPKSRLAARVVGSGNSGASIPEIVAS
jgi:deoxycytidine triphosphate deaminase